MPNFNGAIVMHTLQTINSPATLQEIVMTIAQHTGLTQDELRSPVNQTLEMGERLGFLQKLNVAMTFETLMSEMKKHATNIELPANRKTGKQPTLLKQQKSATTKATLKPKLPQKSGASIRAKKLISK